MQLQREDIESIVSEVLKKLATTVSAPAVGKADPQGDWGVFDRLEDVVAAAAAAYKRLDTVALRERVVDVIRRAARANARRLAEMAVDETGMGRIEDKVRKNLLVDIVDEHGHVTFPSQVAADTLGAGEGEMVLLVRGSSARMILEGKTPLDLSVIGIVDQISSGKEAIYSKYK